MSKIHRRTFITYAGAGALMTLLPREVYALSPEEKEFQLCILHTNDVHSRLDPFPMDGSKYQGLGGAAKRAQLIEKIRLEEKNVLLLDAGDMWQGTPYFNFFNGEAEYKVMNAMKYDAATLGNHDFDIGLDGLNKQLPNAQFQILNANYDFSDSILNKKIHQRTTFQKGPIKVGVFGVGIELYGLVSPALCKNVLYLDPVKVANEQAAILKHEEKCDFVICLSHLGFKYDNNKISDIGLATQSKNIDLIIGGHTHTFLPEPYTVSNLDKKLVVINQVGWAGIQLGRLDFSMSKITKKNLRKFSSISVSN